MGFESEIAQLFVGLVDSAVAQCERLADEHLQLELPPLLLIDRLRVYQSLQLLLGADVTYRWPSKERQFECVRLTLHTCVWLGHVFL